MTREGKALSLKRQHDAVPPCVCGHAVADHHLLPYDHPNYQPTTFHCTVCACAEYGTARPAIHECPDCEGQGWTVVAGHASGCFGGPNCGSTCPVPEQEMCPTCCGSGEVEA